MLLSAHIVTVTFIITLSYPYKLVDSCRSITEELTLKYSSMLYDYIFLMEVVVQTGFIVVLML